MCQPHAVPSTACLELFEQQILVCRRCPQNKALLRKHHHQPRQHACWRRRRDDREPRHLHFNNQFPTVRGGRGQLFVVTLLRVPPPMDARLCLFFFFPFNSFDQSVSLSPPSLQRVSLFAPHVWRKASRPVALGLQRVCSLLVLQNKGYSIFDARLLDVC